MASASHVTIPTKDPDYVQEIDSKYLCIKCGRILNRSAYRIPCGHYFCGECAGVIFDGAETFICAGFDADAVNTFPRDALERDRDIERQVAVLRVYCPNKGNGCGEDIPQNLLENHLGVCEYYTCLNHCGIMGSKAEIYNHVQGSSCPKRRIRCFSCQQDYPFCELDQHLSICEPRVRKCEYSDFGCCFEGNFQEVLDHLASNTIEHERMRLDAQRKDKALAEKERINWCASLNNFKNFMIQQLLGFKIEVENRFRILENTSCDGTQILKISNYRFEKQNAVADESRFISGLPFYKSKNGYKMCARVYLNGDGMARGHYLSLYVVVMKGEYDALQSWPFKDKVTFSLLDMSGGKNHHTQSCTPTMAPDDAECYNRPINDCNRAFGLPHFVDQATVDSNKYVTNDTLHIGIIVGDSKLPGINSGN